MKKKIKKLRADLSRHVRKAIRYAVTWKDRRLVKKLLRTVPKDQRPIYKTVLDNVVHYCQGERSYNFSHGYGTSPVSSSILIKLTKNIFDGLVARQIVGVQPMRGPVGLAYGLRYKESKDAESDSNRLTLEVVSQAVEAGTRKLQAHWSLEAQQDITNLHGLDIEEEIITAVAAEIVQELDTEVIHDLYHLAKTRSTIDFTKKPKSDDLAVDRFALISVNVNAVANEIGRKTRRGCGNFIVCSPVIVSVLQSCKTIAFAPATAGSFKGPCNTMFVGTLNGTIRVYSTLTLPTEEGFDDIIIVGYKGTGDIDTGYVYCPYMMLLSTGVVIHPITFQPMVSTMTRYGKSLFHYAKDSGIVGESGDYYGVVRIKGMAKMFEKMSQEVDELVNLEHTPSDAPTDAHFIG